MATNILFDFVVTVSTLLRYAGRNAGRAALTHAEQLIDRLCDDAFMKRRFPNMKFT